MHHAFPADAFGPILCLIFTFSLMAVIIAVIVKQSRETDRVWRELADSLGLQYLKSDDSMLHSGLERLPLFQSTKMSSVGREIRGTISNREICVFEYATPYGKSAIIRWIFAVRASGAKLKPFSDTRDGDPARFRWKIEGDGDWLILYPTRVRSSAWLSDSVPDTVARTELRARFDQALSIADRITRT
jgi:hypothetical protein